MIIHQVRIVSSIPYIYSTSSNRIVLLVQPDADLDELCASSVQFDAV
jgi:hypothetical protein